MEVYVRPITHAHFNRKPIIYLSVNVLKVTDINTVQQTFTCEMVIRGWTSGMKGAKTWTDTTSLPPLDLLDAQWDDPAKARPMLLEEFDPRLTCRNQVGDVIRWRFDRKWTAGQTGGELELKWRIEGTFLERLEIAKFPRDVQLLQIQLSSPIPQYVVRANGEEAAGITAKLDEIARLEEKMLEGLGTNSELTTAEAARRAELIEWRRGDDRVQRVMRFAPCREVIDEAADFARKSGLSDATRALILSRASDVVQTDNFGGSGAWVLHPSVLASTHHRARPSRRSRKITVPQMMMNSPAPR